MVAINECLSHVENNGPWCLFSTSPQSEEWDCKHITNEEAGSDEAGNEQKMKMLRTCVQYMYIQRVIG